ncbi:unnamed protein product [Spirodela intermedia]|uniref:Hexosyltransferase n=1 Tax=Spirodela intermedia TaxID=51605 RepID=A0A7I8JGQ1_SPIIN|nr:unnamed protein product [Spirodela intermedia]CAA6669131.1 unnamed protein product [Spirodela intermedia]
MPWLTRVSGFVCAGLLIAVLSPSFQTFPPAEAIRSSHFDGNLRYPGQIDAAAGEAPSRFSFRTAPLFRNADGCRRPSFAAGELAADPTACDPSLVHIAITLDEEYLRGSVAAVHSVLQHAQCPESIFFHFLATETASLETLVRSSFPISDSRCISSIRSGRSTTPATTSPRSSSPAWSASSTSTPIWLWSTTSPSSGGPPWDPAPWGSRVLPRQLHQVLHRPFLVGAPPRRRFYRPPALLLQHRRYGVRPGAVAAGGIHQGDRAVDGGAAAEGRIYELGSLPPFLLVFAGRIAAIDHRWNQHGLGGDNVRGSCRDLHPGPVSLLHWSGSGKPWTRLDSHRPCPLDALWAPYDLHGRSP